MRFSERNGVYEGLPHVCSDCDRSQTRKEDGTMGMLKEFKEFAAVSQVRANLQGSKPDAQNPVDGHTLCPKKCMKNA